VAFVIGTVPVLLNKEGERRRHQLTGVREKKKLLHGLQCQKDLLLGTRQEGKAIGELTKQKGTPSLRIAY